MKRSLSLSRSIIFLAAVGGLSVPLLASRKSPKDVVTEFVDIDVEGMRLTPQGWAQADAFFVQSTQPPQQNALVIIAKHYGVGEAAVKGDTAELYVGYEELGRVSPSMDFTPSASGAETRSMYKYRLILTETKTGEPAKSGGEPEWKIEGAQPREMRVTAQAAIRYLTQRRDETRDPLVRQKADNVIARLAPYK